MYRVSQKTNHPKALNNILAYAKPFSAKFCLVIGNLYPHVYTKFESLRENLINWYIFTSTLVFTV